MMTTQTDYETRLAAVFAEYKDGRRKHVLREGNVSVVPLTAEMVDDTQMVSMLSRWRRNAAESFFTQSPVSEQTTANWLRKGLLERPDRILFMVQSADFFVGHIGYTGGFNPRRELEIDNVLKGEKAAPGTMGIALKLLVSWAFEVVVPNAVTLRVFSDNERAIKLYESCGFRGRKLIPMRRTVSGDTVTYTCDESLLDGDRHALEMEILPVGG